MLFLSCAPPAQRSKWIPGLYKYDTSAAGAGYIATYDPSSKKATKLTADGFESPRGLSPFGMDAVPSAHNPGELTIYVINIRPPFVDLDPNLPPGIREAKRDEIATALAKREGPDPCIEVFQYVLGSESMQYVATWADEKIMISLGDVVGLPDGTGSWFTNVVHYKADMVRLSHSKYSQPLISGYGIVQRSSPNPRTNGLFDWVLRSQWMQIRRHWAFWCLGNRTISIPQ